MGILRDYSIAKSSGYTTKESIGYALIQLGLFRHAFAIKGNVNMRRELALTGHCYDVLYNDPAPEVRGAVAANGKCLEDLIKDPNPHVRHQAELYVEHYLQPVAGDDIMTLF